MPACESVHVFINCYNEIMKKILKFLIPLLALTAILFFSMGFLFGQQKTPEQPAEPVIVEPAADPGSIEPSAPVEEEKIDEDGWYTSKEDVALYLFTYGRLPDNFITKSKAKKLGWDNSKKNMNSVCKGCSIGGDRFGNREGLLPDKDGRIYYECDIDFDGKNRGTKRIVFSNDGLIYYTDDHYESFELLYGEE